MATKTDRIGARLSSAERALIDRAAAVTGMSSSAFLVSAAVDRADEVLAASMVTATPVEFFDRLLAALDQPDQPDQPDEAAEAARLTKAAARSFYERHDFTPLPGQPDRLVMKLSTTARVLRVPWP